MRERYRQKPMDTACERGRWGESGGVGVVPKENKTQAVAPELGTMHVTLDRPFIAHAHTHARTAGSWDCNIKQTGASGTCSSLGSWLPPRTDYGCTLS